MKEPSHAAMPTRKYRPSGQSAEPIDEQVSTTSAEPEIGQQSVPGPIGEVESIIDAPPENAPVDEPPASANDDPSSAALNEMGTAPTNRRIILKAADGREVEASWRVTRQYVPAAKGGAWHETGVWAIWNSGGAKVPFEPVGWREAP